MATVANQPGIDEDKDKEGVNLGAPAPTIGGGAAPSGGGIGSQAQKGPTSSGSYTDVGQFLKANAPKARQFAQNAAGSFRDKVSATSQGITQAANDLIGKVDNQKLSTDYYEGKKASEITPGFGQDVVMPTQEEISMGDQQAKVEGLQGNADTLNTFGGRGAYLRETLSPTVEDYGAGEQKLDTIFSMRDKSAQDVFNQARQGAYDLSNTMDSEQGRIGEAIAGVQDYNEGIMDQYGDYLGGLESGIREEHKADLPSRPQTLKDYGAGQLRTIFNSNANTLNKQLSQMPSAGSTDISISSGTAQPSTFEPIQYGGPDINDVWNEFMASYQPDLTGYSAEQAGELAALDQLLGRDKQHYGQYNESDMKNALLDFIKTNYGNIGSDYDPYSTPTTTTTSTNNVFTPSGAYDSPLLG